MMQEFGNGTEVGDRDVALLNRFTGLFPQSNSYLDRRLIIFAWIAFIIPLVLSLLVKSIHQSDASF